MAAKGTRLFKIETVEVVEEGAKEEPGFFYEYLDTAPDAVARTAVAKPRASSVKRSAPEKKPATPPPAEPPAELTESSSNGNAAASAPPSMTDDAPTMKLGLDDLGERAIARTAIEEPEALADSAIDGVEVVETDESYEHNSELLASVEPDVIDAAALEASNDSEELVPLLDEADDDHGFEEDESLFDEDATDDNAPGFDDEDEQLEQDEAPQDLPPPSQDEDGGEKSPQESEEGWSSAAFDLDAEVPDVLSDEGQDLLEEPFSDVQELDPPGAESDDPSDDSDAAEESQGAADESDVVDVAQLPEVDEGLDEDDVEDLPEVDEGLVEEDLDEIPELPDDIPPLDEPFVNESEKESEAQSDKKALASPAIKTMQDGSSGGSKRGTTRLENTRARTNKIGKATSRTQQQRAEATEGDGGDRRARPVPVQQGISAKAHKRITLASYSVVALVILIIGGHWALTNFGIIGDDDSGSGQDRAGGGGGGGSTVSGNGAERTEEERQIDRNISSANQAYNRLEGHFVAAERARQISDREEFRTSASAFVRHYWQVKGYLATASLINLRIGGGRVDTGEIPQVQSLSPAERERIARQANELGRKKRRIDTWIAQLDMHDINDEDRIVRTREAYERIEQEIQQFMIEEGDVTTLVEQKIDEWLLTDNVVGTAVYRIQSGDAEDVVSEATEAIRVGLESLTHFYEAVILDSNQLTDAWRNRTNLRAQDLRELSEIDGVPPLEDFAEYDAFLRTRDQALGF